MTRISKWIALAALVATICLSAGCTGTDTLSSGNVTLSFATTTTNPSATDYACVLMNVQRLSIRIYDGTCSGDGAFCGRNGDCTAGETCEGALADEVIQPDGFGIVLEPGVLFQNFENQGQACQELGTTAVNIDTTNLSSNRYKITNMLVSQPALVQSDGTVLACGGYNQEVSREFPVDTFFELGDSRSNVVTFTIDIATLESLINPQNCDAAALAAAVNSWFSIQ